MTTFYGLGFFSSSSFRKVYPRKVVEIKGSFLKRKLCIKPMSEAWVERNAPIFPSHTRQKWQYWFLWLEIKNSEAFSQFFFSFKRLLHCQLRTLSYGTKWAYHSIYFTKIFFSVLNIYTWISYMRKRKNIFFDPWAKFT